MTEWTDAMAVYEAAFLAKCTADRNLAHAEATLRDLADRIAVEPIHDTELKGK